MIQEIVDIIRPLLVARQAPVVVALDGPSGGGKSTIATALASQLSAAVIPSDDFFAAELTSADWDARSPVDRARDAIDWRRLRELAIEPLRAGRPAVWHPFDFAAGERPDGSYPAGAVAVHCQPAPVIIIDGVYSARPELGDIVDLTILVDAPMTIRQARLAARESTMFLDAWHRRWDAAEAHYFGTVRPPGSFDVVVDTHTGTVQAGVGHVSNRDPEQPGR